MTCGRDQHGDNQQSGCGKPFRWESAPPYVPEIPDQPAIADFLKKAPEMAKQHTHEYVTCDNCKVEPIVGLRFSCIHCPEFNVCSKCEKTHFKHPTDHVFRIYTGSEADNSN